MKQEAHTIYGWEHVTSNYRRSVGARPRPSLLHGGDPIPGTTHAPEVVLLVRVDVYVLANALLHPCDRA